MNKEMKNDLAESPINSAKTKSKDSSVIENLLKSFGISQYYKKLSQYGYDSDLVKLKNMTQSERESLYDTIKVFPGLKSRFNTMFDMLKCIVIEDDESAVNSIQCVNDKKQPRPRTNHSSNSTHTNNSLSTKSTNSVAHPRDYSSSRRVTNQKSLNVLRSLNSNLNKSVNFFKPSVYSKDKDKEENKENAYNAYAGESDHSYIMSMLENSNKNLNLELNKTRKEMEYYKKLSKM